MNLNDLKAPFDPKQISWRVGSANREKTKAMALAYIDSRDVQDRLDSVCGIGGWQCKYALLGKTTVCAIGIKIESEWVWKEDGAGDSDIEAEKGALSDSFKRSAVKWGVGRYLYDVASPWVDIEEAGKSYKIKALEMPRLEKCLSQPSQKPAEPRSETGTAQGQPYPPQPSTAPLKVPMVSLDAIKAEGLTEAEKGPDQLYLWWRALPKPTQTLLIKFKDETLKPAAEKADKK